MLLIKDFYLILTWWSILFQKENDYKTNKVIMYLILLNYLYSPILCHKIVSLLMDSRTILFLELLFKYIYLKNSLQRLFYLHLRSRVS